MFLILLLVCYLYRDKLKQLWHNRKASYSKHRKVVVITGAGQGLGKSSADKLSKAGHVVFALDVKFDKEDDINEKVNYIQCDVTCDEQVNNAVLKVQKKLKEDNLDGIHAIVNFAGVNVLGPMMEMSSEHFKHLFEVNVFGTFSINKAFFPLLLFDDPKFDFSPRIINISSEVAFTKSLPAFTPYSLTKLCVENMSTILRTELQMVSKYAHVVTICPGACSTEMVRTGMMLRHLESNEKSLWKEPLLASSRVTDSYISGKKTTPNEVADLVNKVVDVQVPLKQYTIGVAHSLRWSSVLPAPLLDWLMGSWLFQRFDFKNQIRQWF